MLNKVEIPHLVSSYSLSKIKDEEWNEINKARKSYLIKEYCDEKLLNFPGFTFSSHYDAKHYFKFYKTLNNVFTPPRGNLTKENKYIFCGIKPGHKFAYLSKYESSWLFGPSTKLLLQFLKNLKIYPYFTNIYKSHYDEMNKNIDSIVNEIKIIKKICNPKLIFLGNYEEYYNLSRRLNEEKCKINCYRIYHPSYIARCNTLNNKQKWEKQLINLEINI